MVGGLPSVSVIIPTYNRDAWLADAIESILQQRNVSLDIIIIDDGSTDNTAAVAHGYGEAPVQYAYQPNAGPAAARNRGLQLAQGDVVGFLDSDDVWVADTLAHPLTYLAKHPMVEAVIGTLQSMRHLGVKAGQPLFESFDKARWDTNLGSLCYAERRSFNGSAHSMTSCASAKTSTGFCGPKSTMFRWSVCRTSSCTIDYTEGDDPSPKGPAG